MWDKLRKDNDVLTLSLHKDSYKIITNVPDLLSFLFKPSVLLFSVFYFTVLTVHLPQVSKVLIVRAVLGSR